MYTANMAAKILDKTTATLAESMSEDAVASRAAAGPDAMVPRLRWYVASLAALVIRASIASLRSDAK